MPNMDYSSYATPDAEAPYMYYCAQPTIPPVVLLTSFDQQFAHFAVGVVGGFRSITSGGIVVRGGERHDAQPHERNNGGG